MKIKYLIAVAGALLAVSWVSYAKTLIPQMSPSASQTHIGVSLEGKQENSGDITQYEAQVEVCSTGWFGTCQFAPNIHTPTQLAPNQTYTGPVSFSTNKLTVQLTIYPSDNIGRVSSITSQTQCSSSLPGPPINLQCFNTVTPYCNLTDSGKNHFYTTGGNPQLSFIINATGPKTLAVSCAVT